VTLWTSSGRAIAAIFDDPALELVRLLREAANIEHALLLQYLFAGFSLKERYADLAGSPFGDLATTLLGVAIQEMHHFARVNELLVLLSAEPNLDREDFPIRTGLYPFPLELEPLSLASVAKYVTAESPVGALDPATAATDAERAFREAVARALGAVPVQHIGSLYATIIATLREAVANEPKLLADPDAQVRILEQIRAQGEHDHFLFFRSVFEGTHPVLGGADVWADPRADRYPSLPLAANPTALEGTPGTIADPLARELAWLANCHYWVVLALLYLGHASADGDKIGRAQSHMISCLHPLGLAVAQRGSGLPFDALALNVGIGVDRDSTARWTVRLLREIQRLEAEPAVAVALPITYSVSAAKLTIASLGG
jgi:hypothetical protein